MSAGWPVLLGSLPLLVLAVVLVVLAGALAAADAALGAVSSARVDALVRAGERGAERLAHVVADRPRHVNLLLLLRMVCEVTATVLVAVVALRTLTPTWVAVLTSGLSMVVVSYVVVGVGPRTLGRQHPYTVATAAAGPVRVLGRVLGPLSRLLIILGNALTPGRGFREGPFSSEVELRELVDMAGQRGVVETGEAEMIHSVFELGDTLAREVMVPRTEIVWVERTKSARQALALCLRSGFTRIPVIGDSVDDIVGVVNVKDLARQVVLAGAASTPVAELMRPAEFVPDTKHLTSLLEEMQVSRNHMAVVVDEYGGTAGLLTIEDILEEIVGEITDEYDLEDRPPVEELPDGGVRVSSRLPVHDLGELFDVDLDDTDVETVGGLLAHSLGRVPLPGSEAEVEGLRMRAEGGNDRRGRLRITAVTVHRNGTGPTGADRSAGAEEPGARDGRDPSAAVPHEGSTGAHRA